MSLDPILLDGVLFALVFSITARVRRGDGGNPLRRGLPRVQRPHVLASLRLLPQHTPVFDADGEFFQVEGVEQGDGSFAADAKGIADI